MPRPVGSRWRAALLLAFLSGLPRAGGAEPVPGAEGGPVASGREIMSRVDARPRGDDQKARAVWTLVDEAGRERVRETRILRRDTGAADAVRRKWLLVFDSPPDVRGVALLVWSGRDPGDEDTQWLYLASMRKVKRVAAGDGGQTFMGTDFSYDDLTDRALDEDTHELVRTEEVPGGVRHVVASVPHRESPYSKRIQWVDPASWTVIRIDFEVDGRLEKTLQSEWQRVQEIWTSTRLEMTNHRTRHRTRVEIGEVEYDTGIPDDLFDQQSLQSAGR